MTTVQKRRERVLQQLNSKLMENPKFGLGITGSKIPLKSSKGDVSSTLILFFYVVVHISTCTGAHVYRPSKIPRPESSPRPLPPPGYVSEDIAPLQQAEEHHNPWQGPLSSDMEKSKNTSNRTPPGKKLTIVIHATTDDKHSRDLTHYNSKQYQQKSSRKTEEQSRTMSNNLKERLRDKPTKPTHNEHKRTNVRYSNKRGAPQLTTKPKYDWNKGGRLNELKVRWAFHGGMISFGCHYSSFQYLSNLFFRFLARKYYMIWCRRVFGRVVPSSARNHYQVKLKKKAFTVWHEQWWVARREWKLNIRAECHNRWVTMDTYLT